MFKFFRKNKNDSDVEVDSKWNQQDAQACIVYYIKDDGDPKVDVELRDHSDESMMALSTLMIILQTDATFLETLNVVKSGFIQEGREDLFTRLAMQVALFANTEEEKGEGPCFRPSEVL